MTACACCGGEIDGAHTWRHGAAVHVRCDAYVAAEAARTADEREAWARFAAAVPPVVWTSRQAGEWADTLLECWRARWK